MKGTVFASQRRLQGLKARGAVWLDHVGGSHYMLLQYADDTTVTRLATKIQARCVRPNRANLLAKNRLAGRSTVSTSALYWSALPPIVRVCHRLEDQMH
jgi:hypothetical protein